VKNIEKDTAIKIGMELAREAHRAGTLYPPFNSAHEGFAILLEEVDELWDEVKKKNHDIEAMRKEVVQVGAMAIRFIYDVLGTEPIPTEVKE